MQAIFFRHGPAGSSEAWAAAGRHDKSRPLTPDGAEKTRAAAEGLYCLLKPIDVIATSSFIRARQTADILKTRFPKARLVELACLRPGGSQKRCLSWLNQRTNAERVVLVGHEPSLGLLASRLLSGKEGCFIRLKKGACAVIEGPAPLRPGSATLHHLLQPRQVRRLRR